MNTTNIGKLGEEIARKFLEKNGYATICINFQNTSGRRLGEIDIITTDCTTDELVFVEVKARAGQKYVGTLPEENITRAKLHKLERIAQDYLRKNNSLDKPYRFDVISVWINQETRIAKVKHLKNIFL
jgi:putative endonuclease